MAVIPINKMKIKIKGNKEEREMPLWESRFIDTSDKLKEEYLDRYRGIKSEILSTTRFDENSDLITTYLGKTSIIKDNNIATEERFLISGQGHTPGKLLDSTKF